MENHDDEIRVALPPATVGEITQILTRWNINNKTDQAELFRLLYPELRRLAGLRMRHERPDHTLQPTALVNEFAIQLSTLTGQPAQNRVHLLAVAAKAMRRILVDYARAHNSAKRGGQAYKLPLGEIDVSHQHDFCAILDVHNLLKRLANEDARMAEVIELRYFGGLSNTEVAEMLNIAERTVKRDWQVGRAWLYAQLHKSNEC